MSAAIVSTAWAKTSPVALWRLLRTPTPSGLVSEIGSPACAASLRIRLARSARPVTAMPYFGSGSSMLWPPATGQPASRPTSSPPRSTSCGQLERQHVAGPAEQVDRDDRAATHRVDVGEGVGGGDPAPVVGVVDDGGEEVGRREHHPVAVDPHRGRVVAVVEPDDEVGRPVAHEAADHLLQLAGRDLAGAAAAVGELGQADARRGAHPSSLGRAPGRARGGVRARLPLAAEASGFLVVPPVFKTGEAEHLGLAGSIPVRLRQRRPSS